MLLSDFIQARREKRIEAAKIEGIAEGIAKGVAEGEARAYREFAEWESSPKGSRGTRRGVHRTAPNTITG